MNAAALCTCAVATCGPQVSVIEAADRMRRLHADDLVAGGEDEGVRVPVGVLTDRDIVFAVVSPARREHAELRAFLVVQIPAR